VPVIVTKYEPDVEELKLAVEIPEP